MSKRVMHVVQKRFIPTKFRAPHLETLVTPLITRCVHSYSGNVNTSEFNSKLPIFEYIIPQDLGQTKLIQIARILHKAHS